QIMYVCGKYMKERGLLADDTIVTTVMSNFGLYKALDQEGIRYEKTKVGDRFVYENMSENGFSLGGEQSGHIIFLRHATTGDGILTSIKVMEAMLEKKQSLKTLCQGFTVYPQVLKNVEVKDKESAQKDPAVVQAVEDVTNALGADGRILLRASGTEPLVRVMVEADTQEKCEKYVDQVIAVMKDQGLVLGIR
ncbi:MAG TPA: phosphoglucosamine mutase, partial [Oribacterium sp.]|nr:phosphoglucosamine mutase [Oribacterium sp.]